MSSRLGFVGTALLLAGCQQAVSPAPGSTSAAQKMTYRCEDGSAVEASYPTTDTARILHNGNAIDMRIAVSASGARYVGEGWQWWTKGAIQGWLSPLAQGEDIASAGGLNCAAPG